MAQLLFLIATLLRIPIYSLTRQPHAACFVFRSQRIFLLLEFLAPMAILEHLGICLVARCLLKDLSYAWSL